MTPPPLAACRRCLPACEGKTLLKPCHTGSHLVALFCLACLTAVQVVSKHSAVPEAQGLFNPDNDKDSCGVGFVAGGQAGQVQAAQEQKPGAGPGVGRARGLFALLMPLLATFAAATQDPLLPPLPAAAAACLQSCPGSPTGRR